MEALNCPSSQIAFPLARVLGLGSGRVARPEHLHVALDESTTMADDDSAAEIERSIGHPTQG